MEISDLLSLSATPSSAVRICCWFERGWWRWVGCQHGPVLPWTPVRSFRARRYEHERDDSPLTLLISISITIAFLLYSSSSSGLAVFSFPYAVSVHWACSVCSARSIHRFKLSLYPFPNRMTGGLFALTSLFFARQNYISAIRLNSDWHGLHFFVLK